ncbi:MAG: sigma-70 family RNA polymerase sigma factor [Pirellulales bacterium]
MVAALMMDEGLRSGDVGRGAGRRESSAGSSSGLAGDASVQRLLQREWSFFGGDDFAARRTADGDLIGRAGALLDRLSLEPPQLMRGEPLSGPLARMCETPLLSAGDEQELFLYFNWLKYRANVVRSQLAPRRPAAQKVRLLQQLSELADRCEQLLVQANSRLVVSIVKNFVDRRNAFDDLLSDGMMALLRAVEKFDFTRGFRFSTYATMVVRRHICRQVKQNHKLRSRFVTGAMDDMDPAESTDGAQTPAGEATSGTVSSLLGELLSTLDEREQFIIRRRFSFDVAPRKQTLSFLAAELGVCKERVRQLEQRALRKLRNLAWNSELRQLDGFVSSAAFA